MKIVIISPTYNEKINISKMIPVLHEEVFPKIKDHDMHLLIVDDRSPDGTGDVVREYMKKWKNIELLEGDKNGLGSAYIRGMEYAMQKMHADAVVEFDADFQHNPHDIPRLIAAMSEDTDYVIGSRYIKGGQIPKEWGFDRKIKSIFGSLFARVVLFTFGIHDMTSGFKLTKTSYLEKVDLVNLYSRNYAYKMQILYEVVKLGAKVKEVPIVFYERTQGKSKMDTNDLIESFMVVLRLRARDSMRFIKFLVVGGTGFLIQLLLQEGTAKLVTQDFIAVGVGAEAAILSNFLFNHFWTFSDARNVKESAGFWAKLVKFNVSSLVSIIVQVVAIALAEFIFSPTMHIGSFATKTRIAALFPTIIFIVIPLNYLIYNKIVWKTQYLQDGVSKKA
jgi:dolichol-phosphate mannosyltransferase